ncbi:helicase associated domain-containing protein [Streptomyces sp. NPDC001443]
MEQLETLGMVWSVQASAWEAGLAVARACTDAHGHLLPPTTAVFDDFPICTFMKNARAAARKAAENAQRRGNGESTVSSVGELPESRAEALADLDPGWCPALDIGWQRSYRLALAHRKAGGSLPTRPGQLIMQGEGLGVWIAGQQTGWYKLMPARQWLLESVGIEPSAEGEPVPGVPRSQDARWAANLTAARQFHAREGHLLVPRKHLETIMGDAGDGGREEVVKLGAWVDNTRRGAGELSQQRRADLDALNMRWQPPERATAATDVRGGRGTFGPEHRCGVQASRTVAGGPRDQAAFHWWGRAPRHSVQWSSSITGSGSSMPAFWRRTTRSRSL